jgi:hypothetical protein
MDRQGRRKRLWLLAFAAVIPYLVWAALWVSPRSLRETGITVDQPHHDFGRIPTGPSVSHTFRLRNAASAAVTIREVIPSCKCSSVVLSHKEIAPGDESEIQVTLHTTSHVGDIKAGCQVLFEQEHVPPLLLTVAANVYAATAHFSVDRVYFGDVVRGTAVTETVLIVEGPSSDDHVYIQEVRTSSNLIDAIYDDGLGGIRCTLSPVTPVGTLDERIVVTLRDSDGRREVAIPVVAQIVGSYVVTPASICLGCLELPPAEPVEIAVVIYRRSGVIPAEVNPSMVAGDGTLAVRSRDEQRVLCSIALSVPTSPGFFEGECVISMSGDNPMAAELLRLPYAGYLMPKSLSE